MNLLMRKRGTGKSHMLLETSAVTGYRILTATERHARELANVAKKLGLQIPTPMTIREYKHISRGIKEESVMIDDLEFILGEILREYLHTDVIAATLSLPEDDIR